MKNSFLAPTVIIFYLLFFLPSPATTITVIVTNSTEKPCYYHIFKGNGSQYNWAGGMDAIESGKSIILSMNNIPTIHDNKVVNPDPGQFKYIALSWNKDSIRYKKNDTLTYYQQLYSPFLVYKPAEHKPYIELIINPNGSITEHCRSKDFIEIFKLPIIEIKNS